MDRQKAVNPMGLTAHEMDLVRTALKLLLSTLGKEEADELEAVQEILTKLDAAGSS